MREWRQINGDGVARPHYAAGDDDRHNARFADQVAPRVAVEHCRHQAGLNVIELRAGVAQAGNFDDCRVAKSQPRAGRQAEQINPLGGDILPHLPGRKRETAPAQLVVQFGMDEVNLAKIGLMRIPGHPRAVLDGRSRMRVIFNAKPGEQPDRPLIAFG